MPEKTHQHALGTATCQPCPIEACDWHHDEPSTIDGLTATGRLPDPDAETLAKCDGDLMQATVLYAAIHDAMRIEDVLRAHFETHALDEWALEVARLRAQIAERPKPPQPETWPRPTEARIENGVQGLIDFVRLGRELTGSLSAPDSDWQPTKRQRAKFHFMVKQVLRGDSRYRFEHPEEPA